MLVDRTVDVAPHAGDLHVGLIDEPPIPSRVAAWSGCFDDQRREPLHPPVQRNVVNLDPTLSQQLLEIAIRQPIAQIPPHREQDHLGRELETSERSTCLAERSSGTAALHPASLAQPPSQRSTPEMQQCPPGAVPAAAGVLHPVDWPLAARPWGGSQTRASRAACMSEYPPTGEVR